MRRLVWIALVAVFCFPVGVSAHDDPVVTVRILSNGFNSLDMDAVLGEISDSAILSVDGHVQGADQIEGWVRQQMDSDLRIEIVDIGTPQVLTDGYSLAWTARFSRQDWRRSDTPLRKVSNTVVIHNGRITEWTAVFDATTTTRSAPETMRQAGVTVDTVSSTGMPELFGIPASLIVGALVVVGGATLLLRSALRG